MMKLNVTISFSNRKILLPTSPSCSVEDMLSSFHSTYESCFHCPPPTPSHNFAWLVEKNGVVIPNNVMLGDMCSNGDELKLSQVQTDRASSLASVWSDVQSKVSPAATL